MYFKHKEDLKKTHSQTPLNWNLLGPEQSVTSIGYYLYIGGPV